MPSTGPFLLVYDKDHKPADKDMQSYMKEVDALKMFNMMDKLDYNVTMFDSKANLMKKSDHIAD